MLKLNKYQNRPLTQAQTVHLRQGPSVLQDTTTAVSAVNPKLQDLESTRW